MRTAEFLAQVCEGQGPSQLLAGDLIEGMSPVSFTELITDMGMQQRLAAGIKKAAQKIIMTGKDRHPVTMEALDGE